MPRIHCPIPLHPGAEIALPPDASRHVQVLRLQPGDSLSLFGAASTNQVDMPEGEFDAVILRMGRNDVQVRVLGFTAVSRESNITVELALGVPAGDRMDWLVEKATELGVASIQPLMTERSVLRLSGERAARKVRHWQAIAVAACEQCGRNTVPIVHPVRDVMVWMAQLDKPGVMDRRWVLSPGGPPMASQPWNAGLTAHGRPRLLVLSGPEGGLTESETRGAQAAGLVELGLGPRVMRAETAPLAMLAALTLGR